MKNRLIILALFEISIGISSCDKEKEKETVMTPTDYRIKYEGSYKCSGEYYYKTGIISGDTISVRKDTSVLISIEKIAGFGDTLIRISPPLDFIAKLTVDGNFKNINEFVSYGGCSGNFLGDSISLNYTNGSHDNYLSWQLKGIK